MQELELQAQEKKMNCLLYELTKLIRSNEQYSRKMHREKYNIKSTNIVPKQSKNINHETLLKIHYRFRALQVI